jgi:hypothetical protein
VLTSSVVFIPLASALASTRTTEKSCATRRCSRSKHLQPEGSAPGHPVPRTHTEIQCKTIKSMRVRPAQRVGAMSATAQTSRRQQQCQRSHSLLCPHCITYCSRSSDQTEMAARCVLGGLECARLAETLGDICQWSPAVAADEVSRRELEHDGRVLRDVFLDGGLAVAKECRAHKVLVDMLP